MDETKAEAKIAIAEPPTYSRYPTELPAGFPIGGNRSVTLAPLVNITELQAHLKLLGVFYQLRQCVESSPGLAQTDKDAAWAVFVARAVDRFEQWAMVPQLANSITDPPALDVLMVWHTYLLVRSPIFPLYHK